ncbi:D-alanyl-D-alanine endopeptidase [Limnobacter litoralis]|uniref:D-alanyl-D-alanine carboxypeptidase n=1 Tax=Limnobacter litoralis TaxID=481366 RepID=A0ABQ5YP87_9BURK|nr:D-alanyl-D-alanine endopeptidase [Limnobacter litoralis]GLR26405.1 D-alanyl-D-alanine carboxypeptidase [Limnobacter litoralis]
MNKAIALCACVLISAVSLPSTASAQSGSDGREIGLQRAYDPLSLKSSVALVADANTHEVLFAKNPQVVLPIASISKLMTIMVNLEANLDLNEKIEITTDDIDRIKHTRSRLKPGMVFTRRELMHLALMASENRAAHALARNYPGGMQACVAKMNEKARQLGMLHTQFVEPTGLSDENKSTANDLARMVMQAHKFHLIREYTTDPEFSVETRWGPLQFHNTNRLVKKHDWDIEVQKTGFINEAGRCLVMQTKVAGRELVIVLLDSVGTLTRFADAERIRKYIRSGEMFKTSMLNDQ